MEIIRMSREEFLKTRPEGCHVVTYAEEGFSPLNIYTEKWYGTPKATLVAFADEVNKRNETGSMHPVVPLSAIPRTLVRDDCSVEAISKALENFYAINDSHIRSKCVAIDLGTPHLTWNAKEAIRHSSISASNIEKLIVVGI